MKMQPKRMIHKQNKGFSLIEVIVSMALLGLVFVPLMAYFSNSIRTNLYAKNVQRASLAAQTVVEDIESCSKLEQVAKNYNTISGFEELEFVSGSYVPHSSPSYEIVGGVGNFTPKDIYYYRRPVVIDNVTYNALIKVDTTPYNSAINNPPTTVVAYNTLDIPNVNALEKDGNCIAVEGIETNSIISTFLSIDAAYGMNQLLLGNVVTPVTEAQIWAALTRIMYIKITPDGSNDVRVKVSYLYSCPTIPSLSTPVESDPLCDERVANNKLKNIYLFFNSINAVDRITISDNSNPTTINRYNLYVICQAVAGANPTTEASVAAANPLALRNLEKIYSNIKVSKNGFSNSQLAMISHSKSQRMADVTVSVYKDDSYSEDDLYARLVTTKGE